MLLVSKKERKKIKKIERNREIRSCLFLILFTIPLESSYITSFLIFGFSFFIFHFSFLVFHFSFFIFHFSFSIFFHFFSDLTAEEDFEFKEKCETYESVLTLAGSVVSDILPVSERDLLMSVGVTEEDTTEREGEGEDCALACLCWRLCLFVCFVVLSFLF